MTDFNIRILNLRGALQFRYLGFLQILLIPWMNFVDKAQVAPG
jgi:hypothetical protein